MNLKGLRKPVGPHSNCSHLARRLWDSRYVSDLEELRDRMRAFTLARDWEKFHDPKSLLLALVGEVGELSELFQWLPADQARELTQTDSLKTRVSEELSDVLLYLVRLADVMDIDLANAARRKMDLSESRFAAENFRGVAPEKK